MNQLQRPTSVVLYHFLSFISFEGRAEPLGMAVTSFPLYSAPDICRSIIHVVTRKSHLPSPHISSILSQSLPPSHFTIYAAPVPVPSHPFPAIIYPLYSSPIHTLSLPPPRSPFFLTFALSFPSLFKPFLATSTSLPFFSPSFIVSVGRRYRP